MYLDALFRLKTFEKVPYRLSEDSEKEAFERADNENDIKIAGAADLPHAQVPFP